MKPQWTSRAMKPYFNDGVAHNGHVFGFDDSRLCCVELETGKERWKETRYGHGQVLLLADQGVLVVQAVDGKVALVDAAPSSTNWRGWRRSTRRRGTTRWWRTGSCSSATASGPRATS